MSNGPKILSASHPFYIGGEGAFIPSPHGAFTPFVYKSPSFKQKNPRVSIILDGDHGFGFSYALRIWCSLAAPCLHLLLLGCDSLVAPCLKCKSALFTAPWSLRRRLIRWRLMDGGSILKRVPNKWALNILKQVHRLCN